MAPWPPFSAGILRHQSVANGARRARFFEPRNVGVASWSFTRSHVTALNDEGYVTGGQRVGDQESCLAPQFDVKHRAV
jgi:hypothetical protein